MLRLTIEGKLIIKNFFFYLTCEKFVLGLCWQFDIPKQNLAAHAQLTWFEVTTQSEIEVRWKSLETWEK